ncbi:MAG: PLP-dependent aminotransferase family protein, partial [Methylococcales bacterium]|nr:PLP-dependent aminotransferase family protein [Methylococcales bacterium]
MPDSHGRPMWQQLFVLEPGASQSLQGQLREALVKAILDRRIPIDVPLPSSRELARQLGIARNTVVLAYQHLVDENYLESHERRGYFVNPDILEGRVDIPKPVKPTDAVDDNTKNPGPDCVLDLLVQRNINRPQDWRRFEYPFIYGQTDSSLFPVNDWREASRLSLRVDAISRWTQDRTDHDDELLVEQIHTRVLPRRGVWAEREEILITTGAQNALFLIAQLLLDKSSVAGIEDPCYVDARNIFKLFAGARETFKVGAEGVETDARLARCKLLYVTPSHQCPTTTTMPYAARQALLEQARQHDVTIIEDDYESELNFV